MAYKGDDSKWDNIWDSFFSAQTLAKAGLFILVGICVFIAYHFIISNKDRLEVALDISKLYLRHSPYNYSIDTKDDTITISLWQSGLTTESKKAFNGDSEALSEWEKTKENIYDYIDKIKISFLSEDVKDIKLVVKLVNEDNRARSLLIFNEYQLSYDIVRDTKKE